MWRLSVGDAISKDSSQCQRPAPIWFNSRAQRALLWVSVSHGKTDDMNVKESAIRERLVKRGKKLVKELNGLELSKPKDLSETQYQEAGKLVDVRESDHPHAFVIACIMDRLIKAERAWFNPYRLSPEDRDFDFCTLLKLSEDEIQDHMKGPPALHRFPDKMSQYIHAALRHIADTYEGKAENIWAARPSSAGLVYRFLEFEGMGPKIATMAANILVREFKVPVRDHFSIDISPDRHVRRVFQRLGLIPKQASNEQIIYRARDLNPEYPGLVDLPAFQIGREWCKPKNPRCNECFMEDICPTAGGPTA